MKLFAIRKDALNVRLGQEREYRLSHAAILLRLVVIVIVAFGSLLVAASNAYAQTITVTSPNGGETWYKQATYNITWSTSGSVGNVLIHLYRGGTNVLVISASTANDGSYTWTVPTTLTAASDYRIGMAETDGSPSDFSNNYFTIANATMTVTSPNGGENWKLGETRTITWTTTPGVGNLQIHLYRGGTMVQVLAAGEPNDGSLSWTISGSLTPASDYRIGMSEASDGDPSDFSNSYFTLSSPTVTVSAPNGGENWQVGTSHQIQWTYNGTFPSFDIHVSRDGGSSWSAIATGLPGNYTYRDWTVTSPASSSCRIRVTGNIPGGSAQDASNSNFTISEPQTITVTSPNGGESWQVGSTYNITWSTTGTVGNVLIHLYRGGTNVLVISASTANDGSYSWTVPSSLSTASDYRIGMSEAADGDPSDFSNNYFTITNPSVTLLTPAGAENWQIGTSHRIQWNRTGTFNSFDLHVSRDGGSTWSLITSGLPGTYTYYDWTVTSPVSTSCKIRVTGNYTGGSTSNQNSAYFAIIGSATITYPTAGATLWKGHFYTVTWNSQYITGNVRVIVLRNGVYYYPLCGDCPNTGSQPFEVPFDGTQTPGYDWPEDGNYQIMIEAVNGTGGGTSGYFSILRPTISVTYPNVGQTMYRGQTINVTWSQNQVEAAEPILIQWYRGSTAIEPPITTNAPNTGSYSWVIPTNFTTGTDYRIGMSAYTGEVWDYSDGYNTISEMSITVTSPNGGENWSIGQTRNITWTTSGPVGNVMIHLYRTSPQGEMVCSIAAGAPNTGSLAWTIPPEIETHTDYLIGISQAGSGVPSDFSNALFTVNGASLTLTSPNGGESLTKGQPWQIQWTSTGSVSTVHVELYQGTPPPGNPLRVLHGGAPNTGSLLWNPVDTDLPPGCNYYIGISDNGSGNPCDADGDPWDFSNSAFCIVDVQETITLTSPNGGETLIKGQPWQIQWNSTGSISTVHVELYQGTPPHGSPLRVLHGGTPNTGSLLWNPVDIDLNPACNYYIGISDNADGDPWDFSNAAFCIANPSASITLTSPNGGETLTTGQPWQIQWTSTGSISTVHVELYQGNPPNGISLRVLHGGTPNTGSLWWNPVDIDLPAACNYYLGISDAADGNPWDFSNTAFCIANPPATITLTSPNGGEFWQVNQPYNITWSSSGAVGNVLIHLYRGSPPHGTFLQSITSNTQNDGVYQWTVWPWLGIGTDYYIGIADVDNEPWDYSNAPFMIQDPCVDGEISGYVDNPDGERVNGATVTVQRTDVPGSSLNAQTNANGEFLFANLALGTYSLRAIHPDYEEALLDVFVECYEEGGNPRMQFSIRLSWRYDLAVESVNAYQTVRVDQPGGLIAEKPTVVIATVGTANFYVRDIDNVTGRLRVLRNNQPVTGEFIPSYRASDGYSVKSDLWPFGYSDNDRRAWRDALYFVVTNPPAAGNVSFEVRLDKSDQNAANNFLTSTPYVFSTARQINLHLVPVSTSDRPFNSAYFGSLVQAVNARLHNMLPFGQQSLHVIQAPRLNCTDLASSNAEVRRRVVSHIETQAANSNDNDFFVGIYPATLLPGGWRGSACAACTAEDPSHKVRALLACDPGVPGDPNSPSPTVAQSICHEFGHAFGCLGIPSDQCADHCEVYDNCGTFGQNCVLDEWGLNPGPYLTCERESRAWEPDGISIEGWPVVCRDVMDQYYEVEGDVCSRWPRWDPTYMQFKQRALENPSRWSDQVPRQDGPYAVVSGIVELDSTVANLAVACFDGIFEPTLTDSGEYSLRWFSTDSTELSRIYFRLDFLRAEEPIDWEFVYLRVSRPSQAAFLVLNIGATELASISASGTEPILNIASPNGGEVLSGSAVVSWNTSDVDGDSLLFDVFVNRDGGEWQTVAAGLSGTSFVWDVDYFPGTTAGRIKVVASDGWHTASDSSDGVFTIAAHNPTAYIESPQDTAAVLATSFVSLSGRATDLEDGNLPNDSLMWSSDLDGFLGRGSLVQAANLSPGLHLITLSAADQDNNHGYDYAYVRVLADFDQDGMDDGWETEHGLDTSRHDAYADLDMDQLMNGQEYALGTDPNNPDTDGDTYGDGQEVAAASDPLDPASVPSVVWVTPPAGSWALIPNGQIGFNDPVLFSWNAATADDSLRPLRYEVHVDSDPNFSNALIASADTQTTVVAQWQLPVGIVYFWKVKVTDTYGHWIWSGVATITRGSNPQVPVRITDLTAMVTASGLELNWNPVTLDTAGNPITVGLYIVYASPAMDQPYLPIACASTNTWTDTEVPNLEWRRWFYEVEASTNYSPPGLFSRTSWPTHSSSSHDRQSR